MGSSSAGAAKSATRATKVALACYIAATAALSVWFALWSWHMIDRIGDGERASASLLWWDFAITTEVTIFVLVVSFGVIGSVVHSSNSLATYIGNRRFAASWTAWYLLRPLIAGALALLTYTVFRAGFVSTAAPSEDINLFGVAAISGLAGLFSKQVIDKLEDVMNVVFASRADEKRTDKLKPLSIMDVRPDSGLAGAPVRVTITGSGFGSEAMVLVGDQERVPAEQHENTLAVDLTEHDTAEPGALELRVRNSSGEISDPAVFTVRP